MIEITKDKTYSDNLSEYINKKYLKQKHHTKRRPTMENQKYKYNHQFIKHGEVFQDKNNNIFRFNKNAEGKLAGGQIELSETGELISTRYIDNEGNVQTALYKNGEIFSKFQEKYIDGKFIKHGSYEQYENGIVTKIGQYNNGHVNGDWLMLNEKKDKIIHKKFENGVDITSKAKENLIKNLYGTAEDIVDAFSENDPARATKKLLKNMILLAKKIKRQQVPQIKINFQEVPELEVGKVERGYATFYPDGSPKIVAEMAAKDNDGNIIYNGNYIEHYDSGKIKIKAKYNEKGKLNGEYKEFFEDGTLKKEGAFIDGEKTGSHKEYDNKGNLISNEKYTIKENKKENIMKEQHRDNGNNKPQSQKKVNIPKKKKSNVLEGGRGR